MCWGDIILLHTQKNRDVWFELYGMTVVERALTTFLVIMSSSKRVFDSTFV